MAKDRIDNASSLPYFLKDNKGYMESALSGKSVKKGYNSSKLGRQTKKDAISEYTKGENNKSIILSTEQQTNINLIAKDLGITVTPINFFEANEGRANVNYHKGREYKDNCQSTVIIHEARRRGLNITSRGYSSDIDSISYQLGENSALGWINPKTNKAPQLTILSTNNKELLLAKIKKNIVEGRYTLGVNTLVDGHIVIAEKLKNGKLIIYDTQNGNFLSIEELLKDAISVELLKIDKLILNDEIIKSISHIL